MTHAIIYLEKIMRSNIVYNYLAQIFLASAGIITLPFLLERMGAELYAFVAIFFTVQTIFSILDGGLSGSLSREFALNKETSTRSSSPKSLLNKAECIFIALSTSGILFIYSISGYISTSWLRLSAINTDEAELYLGLIGMIAALRLWSGLYRSVLIGYEKQKYLSVINIATTSARYIFVLPLLDVVENTGFVYFLYQLFIAVLEIITLKVCSNSNINEQTSKDTSLEVKGDYFKSILRTSSQIWSLTLIWVMANQVDKLILTRLISLQDFGYFSVVSSLSAGILLLGAPVANAVMPNLSRFIKSNNHEESQRIYFMASKLVSIVGFPVAFTLVALPEHALFLFVNNVNIANDFSKILQCYSIGSFFLLMSGMTFLLKQSSGDLSKNIKQNIYYLLTIVILMLTATRLLGLEGAAYAWLTSNLLLISFIIKPLNVINGVNFHNKWIYSFVLVPVILSAPAFAAAAFFSLPLSTRHDSVILVLLVFFAISILMMLPLVYSRIKFSQSKP
jgi:O-antigen/teichoic acid export membrane protein